MSNKIVTTKSNAMFLAAILIAGTFAAIYPSFMVYSAQAQPSYYGMDSYDDRKSYDKRSYGNDYSYESQHQQSYKQDYKPKYQSYGKDDRDYDKSKNYDNKKVEINKIKCINTNLNINGNNAGNISIDNKGQGYSGGYSSAGSGGYGEEGYGKQGKSSDCIINNNNTNINIAGGGGGNQTTAPKAILNVSKIVTCTYLVGGLTPETACRLIEENITENQFLIEVTDDNPTPSQFPGSESGTIVTLGAGNYVISETFDATSLQAEIESIEDELKRLAGGGGVRDYNITGPIVSFTGDCNAVNGSFEATGTIGAGESQTCEIENHFDIGLADEICTNGVDDDGDGLADTADPDCTTQGGLTASNINPYTSAFDINSAGNQAPSFSSPPTIAQETEDDLSALEKTTKLKQQWLELLP